MSAPDLPQFLCLPCLLQRLRDELRPPPPGYSVAWGADGLPLTEGALTLDTLLAILTSLPPCPHQLPAVPVDLAHLHTVCLEQVTARGAEALAEVSDDEAADWLRSQGWSSAPQGTWTYWRHVAVPYAIFLPQRGRSLQWGGNLLVACTVLANALDRPTLQVAADLLYASKYGEARQ